MNKEDIEVLAVKIPKQLKRQLEGLAEKDRRSLTQYLIVKFEELVEKEAK